ncbi:GNAT family N-acetyltransferase [Mangrovicoccus algicola]|uniref:N-acetyltransferase n=1 Tax=Mangrovicoccus algicola TaxID=2771008 RepID=A0A8J7CL08_9RHOB|nr:N-acetyltransferase [Mangrovicoccus algicola]MBE3639421.1 N-acetyltransferase [Mangrovicoccus algicola]
MLRIRQARPEDHTEISVLVVTTFGQNNEHRLIEALRAAGAVTLELVALLEDRIVGHVCFSRFDVPPGWWVLAPVSVTTAYQNRGIGSELVRYGLDQARQQRAGAVVVVGNPDYYRRFGFVFDGPAHLSSPYPAQYTGLYPIAPETAAAAVALRYPAAFEEA